MINLKKSMTFFLIVAILVMYLAPNIALAQNNQSSFEDLPEDAIVCYAFNEPIYKHEVEKIGEYYFITKDMLINSSGIENTNNHSGYYTESYIPNAHRNHNITVTGYLSAIQFGQNDKIMYLIEDAGEEFASSLQSGYTKEFMIGLLLIALGLPEPLSKFVAILSGFVILGAYERDRIASEIRNCTDNHQGAIIWQGDNMYGTFISVHPWDGMYCIRYGTSSSSHTSYVSSVLCQCDASPFSTSPGPVPVYPM